MPADASIYLSERLADSYARFRPPVHPFIVERIRQRVAGSGHLASALDVGCGAGVSAGALMPFVDRVVGVDPSAAMVRRAAARLPRAAFVQARFEALPFAASAFELVASAGAINYADPGLALSESSRVLQAGGWFVAYDFGDASRLSVPSDLPERHREFRAAYPPAPGYALELEALPFAAHGLRSLVYERFVVPVRMTAPQYVDYLLGESGVELAIAAGTDPAQIAAHCRQLFGPVFGDQPGELLFDAELLLAQRLLS